MSEIYILISIVVLAIIAVLMIYGEKRAEHKRLSKLTTFAFLLIVLGIVFADQGRLVSYSFMGLGVVFAISDIFLKSKK